MRFADVDTDGFEIDSDADDRALFHVIETRAEIGDLSSAEAWALLAERYPGDARLRVLATFHSLDEGDAFHDAASLARAVAAVVEVAAASQREACAALVAIASEIADDAREAFAPLERAVAPIPDETVARRSLRKLREQVLDEAEARTRDGMPFGERAQSSPSIRADPDLPPRPYSATTSFAVGERVAHPKFGVGLVVDKGEGKIDVAFESGRKRLVSA